MPSRKTLHLTPTDGSAPSPIRSVGDEDPLTLTLDEAFTMPAMDCKRNRAHRIGP
ncbi:MAG: hypothetical protein MJZ51_03970 [Bacteroidales bacterium]|nr:hypothetical protein [Bacteroidales bacterium]